MQLAMDIRIASEDARFGFVFSQRGIVPEAASSWFLPRIVGISKAAEWCFTSRVFRAPEALDAGLVRSLHAPDELMPAARELASEIVANSAPVSVALSRMMLWRMMGASNPMEAHRIDSRAVNYTGGTPDAREGITAFFERRPAQWSMSVNDDLPPFVPWWDEPRFE
jgi:enoyl-CoA hydratase/carnithine racemase